MSVLIGSEGLFDRVAREGFSGEVTFEPETWE